MRKITITFLTIVFCLTSSIVWSETVKPTDLVKRNGIIYNKRFSDKPYSGSVKGYGGHFLKGTYRNGKREGVWEEYFDKGQLRLKGTWKNGKREGVWETYHDNGQLSEKRTYKDGKREGLWELYDKNGQLWKKETWKNGEIIKVE